MTAENSILIVEDEMIVAADLSGKLEKLGYSICAVTASGEEALTEARHHQPSLVLMDIQLAGVCDGIDTAQLIQNQFDIPIIYLTAHSDPATLARAKKTCPSGYILKPFEDSQLATQVELALFKHAMERQTREQREWLEVTLQSIGDAVIATDNAGRVLFMNRSAENLTGWQEEEAKGEQAKDIYRLINNSDNPGSAPGGDDFQLLTKSGRKTAVEHRVAPIRNGTGEPIGMVITFQDISDRRAAEKELQHSRHLLTRAQAIAHLGSWEHDPASGAVHWSDEVFRIFGLQQGESKPSYATFLQRVHPDDRDQVEREYGESLSSETYAYDLEHRIIRPDGTIRHIRQKCEHQRDSSGDVLRSIGMAQDITEQKLAQQELQRSNRELEQFASIASHDLQSPLVTLKRYLQLIGSRYGRLLDSQGQDFVGRAIDAADHMQSMVRDLLSFSRATVRKQPSERCDLQRLAEEVMEVIQPEIAGLAADIRLQPLPAAIVQPDQFKRLLQNLIGNGMKYNTSPTPTVSVSCEEQPAQYHFRVADNGIGIDPQYHDRIFELFHRLHTTKDYPGTGMGLAICRKIVEHHGGALWLDSEPGRGSTFHFTLPRNGTDRG